MIIHARLRQVLLLHGPFSDLNKRIARGVAQLPQIRGVDLCMPVESPEDVVHKRGVEVDRQTEGQRVGNPGPGLVKHVQVIFESQGVRVFEGFRCDHAGGNAPLFLL